MRYNELFWRHVPAWRPGAEVLAQHLIILLSYFSMMKSMQKSSRNEASALPARIGQSLGMVLTTASLGS
jgi:hypothetical protein